MTKFKKLIIPGLLATIMIIGLWVRLYKIENPVADWHSWRQADTSAVTRNYVKHGLDLLHPTYDDMSDVSGNGLYNPLGYRYVEFPIYNALHFLLYSLSRPFGTLEMWGRLTSALSALLSTALLFFLVKRHTSFFAGLVAAGMYIVLPFNIYFTRVILPDPLMVTFFLLALNCYDQFTQKNKKLYVVLTVISGAVAVLVKPVAIFFLLPITVFQLRKYRLQIFRQAEFYFVHAGFVLPFLGWRAWSHLHPEGIPASNWLLNGNGIRFKPSFFQWMFGTRIGTLILGKWGIWPALYGFMNGNWYLLTMVLSVLIYVTVFATGNVQHDYYQIPIIPAVAACVGVGVDKLWHSAKRVWLNRVVVGMCLVFMLYFSWLDIKGLYQINNWSIVHAGIAADEILPPDAKVLAPYQADTAFLYQINRPGFAYTYEPVKDAIDWYHIGYYVSVNYDAKTREIMKKYTVVKETPEFVIVKLEEKLNLP